MENTFYPLESGTYIRLSGGKEVPKAFYDLIWDQVFRHVTCMSSGSEFDISCALDAGTYGLLSEHGIKLAEECIDHFAEKRMLPVAAKSIDNHGNAQFWLG